LKPRLFALAGNQLEAFSPIYGSLAHGTANRKKAENKHQPRSRLGNRADNSATTVLAATAGVAAASAATAGTATAGTATAGTTARSGKGGSKDR
jgi:hypothetical protein